MKKKPRLNKLRTIIITTLLTLIPFSSFAHDVYFFQVLINTGTNEYQSNVLKDDNHLNESSHVEAELGNFEPALASYKTTGAVPVPTNSTDSSWDKAKNTLGQDGSLAFGFEPKQVGGYAFGGTRNDATSADADRAYGMSETLVPEMNQALKILNGGKDFQTPGALIDMASALSKGAPSYHLTLYEADNPKTGHSFDVQYGTWLNNHQISSIDKQYGLTKADYVVIKDNGDGSQYEFIWRMPKGYETPTIYKYTDNSYPPTSVTNPYYNDAFKDDIQYISWNELEYQANYTLLVKGDTADNASTFTKPGPLEGAIVGMFTNLFNGLRDMLGLYSTSDLVFNQGTRNVTSFWHGVMSKEWENRVLEFQWLFQAMAWALIAFAVLKILIQKNLSTVNPAIRVSLIEDIQNLLLTGVVIANLFPIVNLLMTFNEKLVNVFGSAVDTAQLMPIGNNTGVLAGILIAFAYFSVNLYLNMTYIFRAISIAVLVATGPLFIVSLAFGGRWKGLFNNWLRELIANIYLQSFHAFVLSFFAVVATSSRGIESLAVAFALIPMTQFFKGMLVGSAGGLAGSLGMASVTKGTQLAGSALGGTVGAIRAKVGGGNSSSNSSKNTNSSNNFKNEAGNSSKISSLTPGKDTQEANESFSTPVGVKGAEKDLYQGKNEADKPSSVSKLEKAMQLTKVAGASGLSGAMSLGKTFGGAGMAIAFGGAEGGQELARQGTKMADEGLGEVAEGAVGIGAEAGSYLKNGVQKINPMSHDNRINRAYKNGQSFNSALYKHNLPNGNVEVHRDGAVMRNEGILKASEVNGNAMITYDKDSLQQNSPHDYQNLQRYEQVFKNGNKADKDHLKAQGIEGVYNNGQNLVVAYNNVGKEKLGFQSINTTGDGRIVETKLPTHPMETRKTFDVTRTPPQKQDGNENPAPQIITPSNPEFYK